jgi:hypothetical protein
MENLDYWRLCDELSVIQSALLIVGVDPASFQDSIVSSSSNDRPNGYDAAIAALTHAILAKRLPATIRRLAWEKDGTKMIMRAMKLWKETKGASL